MISYLEVLKEADTLVGLQLRTLTEEGRPYVGYLYGGDGRIATEAYIAALMASYPNHFRSAGYTLDELVKHLKGVHVLDCSQLIVSLTDAPRDMSSGTLLAQCTERTTPEDGVEGSLLWKPGHVALDIGRGFCLEMVGEMRDLQINRIAGRGFTTSARLPWVDYTGASNK